MTDEKFEKALKLKNHLRALDQLHGIFGHWEDNNIVLVDKSYVFDASYDDYDVNSGLIEEILNIIEKHMEKNYEEFKKL